VKTPESDGRVYPALILDTRGELLGAGITNEKGYRKSLERSEAWLLDGLTGRLLPAAGVGGVREVRLTDGRVEITADAFSPAQALTGAERESLPEEGGAQADAGVRPPADSPAGGASRGAHSAFLYELQELIYRRRETMPEGSYTTHLFEKGEGKIRKKTGEEAVELLLAEDDDELTAEAADLLYHLMVLLAARDLSISDVIDVLRKRHQ
jgi:phosphoribosyl-ATP pyrophosphohydrolase